MKFGHDIAGEVHAAIELVNTAPGVAGADELAENAALDAFLDEHAFLHLAPTAPEELTAIHGVREQLTAILEADSIERAAELVNRMIAEAHPIPHMTNHDGLDWHIDFHQAGAELHDHVGIELAMALATLLVRNGRDRIRRCAAPDCHRYLADLSRNGSRRYCEGRNCGNRQAVRTYRARKRER